jgi:hypothetical protein
MSRVRATFALLLPLLGLQIALQASGGAAPVQPVPDMEALARNVHQTLLREYREEQRFTYIEKRRDVEVSKLGKVYVGPLRTFEVYPRTFGPDYKRLIEIEGKPLDAAELAKRDEEHRRNVQRQAERERAESPERRAARLKKQQDELTETIDDAARVFAFGFLGREVVDGESLIVVSLKPRQNARVTSREGAWMKKLEGKLWIAESDYHIARIRVHAVDDLSIGWGVVAKVEPGSGFEYVRKRIGSSWVPLELKVEGSGRTLLFRRFSVKTVTTYSNHQRWNPQSGSLR